MSDIIPSKSKRSPEPKVIYQDAHVLVIEKPSGLLSQGDFTGQPSLVTWAQDYLNRPYVGLIHRLDKETSGLMVLAKRTKSAQRLTQFLKTGKLVRKYQAWVIDPKQNLKPGVQIELKHYLLKDTHLNRVKIVKAQTPGAQLAQLKAQAQIQKPVSPYGPLTLVEFELQTGRSHQIRVQLSALDCWILGDSKYSRQNTDFYRLCLHSSYLSFPDTDRSGKNPEKTYSFNSPISIEF